MAKSTQPGRAPLLIGCVFALGGLVWLIVGHLAIGLGSMALGMVFIIIGAAALRKTDTTGAAKSDTLPKA
jgi:hypothetical protein